MMIDARVNALLISDVCHEMFRAGRLTQTELMFLFSVMCELIKVRGSERGSYMPG